MRPGHAASQGSMGQEWLGYCLELHVQRIVFTKSTSAPSEERSATDFVKFVHSVSFYPASTASYWNLPTNVQPASSQPAASYPVAASYQAAPARHEALDGYKPCATV
jgi:hypothetical protein